MAKLRNFGEDLAFLNKYVETIVLGNNERQKVIVVPEWQGRTMTSTTDGAAGFSYGWVNYKRISSGKIEPQINLFGGEDRFWISPEGSQFSFFFDPGVEMELANWRTPAEIDTHAFEVTDRQVDQVSFQKKMQLRNYSGHQFELQVDRTVRIRTDEEIAGFTGMTIPEKVNSICHESHNQITNAGVNRWERKSGLPAVWILCMNKPSPKATVVVPFRRGSVLERGRIVTSDYFGTLDSSRLSIREDLGLVFFLGDGQFRSKLGVSFERAVDHLGAWDAENQCLTIIQFNLPQTVSAGYTNNLWKHSDRPYQGDVVNSYNDGPNESGGLMGPFYELETLGPALPLAEGESWTHRHRTMHFQGDRKGLDQIAKKIFGVGLGDIETAF